MSRCKAPRDVEPTKDVKWQLCDWNHKTLREEVDEQIPEEISHAQFAEKDATMLIGMISPQARFRFTEEIGTVAKYLDQPAAVPGLIAPSPALALMPPQDPKIRVWIKQDRWEVGPRE
jgi:hypothetical protein